jgi:hypothetical protein
MYRRIEKWRPHLAFLAFCRKAFTVTKPGDKILQHLLVILIFYYLYFIISYFSISETVTYTNKLGTLL